MVFHIIWVPTVDTANSYSLYYIGVPLENHVVPNFLRPWPWAIR